jgi:hypothetical protein
MKTTAIPAPAESAKETDETNEMLNNMELGPAISPCPQVAAPAQEVTATDEDTGCCLVARDWLKSLIERATPAHESLAEEWLDEAESRYKAASRRACASRDAEIAGFRDVIRWANKAVKLVGEDNADLRARLAALESGDKAEREEGK